MLLYDELRRVSEAVDLANLKEVQITTQLLRAAAKEGQQELTISQLSPAGVQYFREQGLTVIIVDNTTWRISWYKH